MAFFFRGNLLACNFDRLV